VELWALTRKPRLGQTILSSRGPGDYGFDIKFRQGKMFHAGIGDGSRWLVTEANATYSYTKEAWYHIAYVVTPTNYTAYINGELTARGAIQPPGNPVLYDATHQLRFGMDAPDARRPRGKCRRSADLENRANAGRNSHQPETRTRRR
jgi:hypothetical protein